MAPAKLAKARPASSVTVRVARRPAMATSPPIETSAPAMPASGTASEVALANEKAIMNEAAAAAACGAPNKAGSASGLRSRPCSAAPESPSVAPISSASSVRGRRISRTMMPAGPCAVDQAGKRGLGRESRRPDHERKHREHDYQRDERRLETPTASPRHVHRRPPPAALPTDFRLAVKRDCAIRMTCIPRRDAVRPRGPDGEASSAAAQPAVERAVCALRSRQRRVVHRPQGLVPDWRRHAL